MRQPGFNLGLRWTRAVVTWPRQPPASGVSRSGAVYRIGKVCGGPGMRQVPSPEGVSERCRPATEAVDSERADGRGAPHVGRRKIGVVSSRAGIHLCGKLPAGVPEFPLGNTLSVLAREMAALTSAETNLQTPQTEAIRVFDGRLGLLHAVFRPLSKYQTATATRAQPARPPAMAEGLLS